MKTGSSIRVANKGTWNTWHTAARRTAVFLPLPFIALTSCATFSHQVHESEPHATLILVPHPPEPGVSRRAISVDHRSLPFWRSRHTLKLKPGSHVVAYRERKVVYVHYPYHEIEEAGVILMGLVLESAGANVAIGKPRPERYQELRYSLVTNKVTVSNGEVCVLDGFRVNKSPAGAKEK
jgi:hypothetical protein